MATAVSTTLAYRFGSYVDPYNLQSHIFMMSDGKEIAISTEDFGADFACAYRIKSSGVWGSRVRITTSPGSQLESSIWTRIGDDLYGLLYSDLFVLAQTVELHKLSYAGGVVTHTSAIVKTVIGGNHTFGQALYADTTNNLIHVWYRYTVGIPYHYRLEAYNPSLAVVYGVTDPGIPPIPGEFNGNTSLVGSGNTFFAWIPSSQSVNIPRCWRILGSGGSYTITEEINLPATILSSWDYATAIWDGSSFVGFACGFYDPPGGPDGNSFGVVATTRTSQNVWTPWVEAGPQIDVFNDGRPYWLAVGRLGSDLCLLYCLQRDSGGGPHYAVYRAMRTSGAWAAPVLVAGLDGNDYGYATVALAAENDTVIRLMYIEDQVKTLWEESAAVVSCSGDPGYVALPALAGVLNIKRTGFARTSAPPNGNAQKARS